MSPLRLVYLGLALWGGAWAASDLWFNAAEGVTMQGRVLAGNLVVAEMALALWCIAEVYVRKNWVALVALPVTWFLGLACALPLYLFLRTAPVR